MKAEVDKANYKELANFKMPVFSNNVTGQKNELYPLDILEREVSRVKIHYVAMVTRVVMMNGRMKQN